MSNSLCFTPLISFKPTNKPGITLGRCNGRKVQWMNDVTHSSKNAANLQNLEVKAAGSDQRTKPNSIVCAECDGNGAVSCKQCKGSGVNSVDHFNGQFKAGGLCWLCRGKKQILCGNCNGAGFIGGIMSTIDD
ncbi:uncharacterized protein LOC113774710 [Coffea eugenioides]|uniref:Protein BUNDLE SHEATH DEFECTIVE 2, chloroplastic n=1 Tax=Coffea arabica TaxID=13443 RepID=A0A6P6SUM9_COFAR|nr:uncharacterized protein LOC113694814 [Coffea arabica]XP_027175113.1 uncharacterized protein LOC113774710 [Coffea eugenioides]